MTLCVYCFVHTLVGTYTVHVVSNQVHVPECITVLMEALWLLALHAYQAFNNLHEIVIKEMTDL